MNPKHFQKAPSGSSYQFSGLFEVEQGPTLDLVLFDVFLAD